MAGKSTMRSEPDSMPRPSGQGNSARKHAAEKIRYTYSCRYPYRKRTHVVGMNILRRLSDSRLRN